MSVLSAVKLSKSFNIYPVFKDVSFQVNAGEKVALVGVNGAGKSTLLKIIAGDEQADGGDVVTMRGLRIAYLAQEATFDSDKTLHVEMLSVFDNVRNLQSEITQLEHQMGEASNGQLEALMQRYADLTHRFELEGGYDYETQITIVLEGLNFPREMWERPVSKFSGGQKTRAALAKALLSNPGLLMLDEPTNHLDLKTLEWLENFLRTWEGTLIVISHDRYFLDQVVTRVLDLSFGKVEDYPGNYSKYLNLRAERLERAFQEYEAQQEHIAKTEDFIRRYKNGQRYRQARGRQKQLDRLERIDRPKEKDKLHLSLQTDLRSGRLSLATEDLTVGYQAKDGPRTLFKAPDLEILRGERVAIIGPNGTGKTTFLKTIMGEQMPLGGLVEFGPNVKVAYYAQSHEGLNFNNTILDEILWTQPMSEGAARSFLGRFMFSNDDVFKKVSDLSGGERSRVALAKLTLAKANFLILDEPTNHLDINAREALEEVLNEFNGTLLFVSHDRYFIDALATQVWAIEQGQMNTYLGNYTDYLEWLNRARQRQAQQEEVAKPVISTAKSNPNTPKVVTNGKIPVPSNSKEERQRAKQVATLETNISNMEKRLNDISFEMNEASQKGDVTVITRLSQEYQQLSEELEKLYVDWGVLAG